MERLKAGGGTNTFQHSERPQALGRNGGGKLVSLSATGEGGTRLRARLFAGLRPRPRLPGSALGTALPPEISRQSGARSAPGPSGSEILSGVPRRFRKWEPTKRLRREVGRAGLGRAGAEPPQDHAFSAFLGRPRRVSPFPLLPPSPVRTRTQVSGEETGSTPKSWLPGFLRPTLSTRGIRGPPCGRRPQAPRTQATRRRTCSDSTTPGGACG